MVPKLKPGIIPVSQAAYINTVPVNINKNSANMLRHSHQLPITLGDKSPSRGSTVHVQTPHHNIVCCDLS